ncbi:hypothetical protein GCM10023340_12710 [Nocardioides marinquilinus]|uniref:PKD domain-containing protein n=1 Tax=Nocardioides marinquilinus TaxID=1210400 RepID=A0ABP9PE55_9ACTN
MLPRPALLALPALLLAPLAGLAAPAHAAASTDHDRWLEPAPLVPLDEPVYGYHRDPAVATNARGDSVAVYVVDPPSDGVPTGEVRLTRRPAGGTWSYPVEVSGGRDYGTDGVAVGIDAAGRALVAWSRPASRFNPVNDEVLVRTVAADGTLGVTRRLSADRAEGTDPAVAVAPGGRAVVTWLDGGDVRAATGTTAGLGTPVTVAEGAGGQSSPTVAIAPTGDAVLAWDAAGAGADAGRVVRSCTWAAAAGGCGPVADVDGGTSSASALDPAVAVGDGGDAVLCYGLDAEVDGLRYAVRPGGGDWSTPAEVTAAAPPALGSCQVALRPDDALVVGHADRDGRTYVAVRGDVVDGPRGPVGAGRRLNGPDDGFRGFSLDAGRAGDVAVVVSGRSRLLATTVPRTARQATAVQRLEFPEPGSGYGATLAAVGVDGQGNAYGPAVNDSCPVTYCANPQWRPWTITLDAAAPALEGVAGPRAATVGDVVRLRAVGVRDLASAVTATWRFSDGSTRTGTSVSKVVRQPGRLVARLQLVDAAGHRTVQQVVVTVTR